MHVVGAGLAGLAAAVALAGDGRRGRAVRSGAACRRALPLLFRCRARLPHRQRQPSAAVRQPAALAYLERIGALDTLRRGRPRRRFPFVDLATGERWALRPNRGRGAVVGLERRRGGAGHAGARLSRGAAAAAGRRRRHGRRCSTATRVLFRRLVAAARGRGAEHRRRGGLGAAVAGASCAETLGRGGAACRPLLPREGLSESLVDPALACLRAAAAPRSGSARRLRALGFGRRPRRRAVVRRRRRSRSAPQDSVILAVPAAIAARAAARARRAGRLTRRSSTRISAAPRRPARRCSSGWSAAPRSGCSASAEVVSVTVSAADRHRRPAGRRAARAAVARCRAAHRPRRRSRCRRRDRQGAARDLSRHPGAAGAPPGAATRVEQSSPCRRLCRYRLACHDRRRYSLRPCGGGRVRRAATRHGAGRDAPARPLPKPIEDRQRALP